MTIDFALKSVQTLTALAVFFQTTEYLDLQKSFSEKGIWRWSEIRTEFSFLPKGVQSFFDFLLKDRHFLVLLWTRLIFSLLFLFFPTFLLVFFLFVSSLLISQRFRGSFNGGSDYMSLILLSSLSLQSLLPYPFVTKGVLWYIALQSATSYFIAGLVKIKQRSWKTGEAMTQFIHSPNYNPPSFVKKVLAKKPLALTASWLVMGFELFFPLIFALSPGAGLYWLGAGFLFHLNNTFLFGLNRFLIIWAATYPALYFCLVG